MKNQSDKNAHLGLYIGIGVGFGVGIGLMIDRLSHQSGLWQPICIGIGATLGTSLFLLTNKDRNNE